MVYVIITLLLELQIIATHESEFCLLAIFLLSRIISDDVSFSTIKRCVSSVS